MKTPRLTINGEEVSPQNIRLLTVGIDSYKEISGLQCATRDAMEIHALLQDTFGDDIRSEHLSNQNATAHEVLHALDRTFDTDVEKEDVAIFYYSGQGSEDQRLTVHDTKLGNAFRSSSLHIEMIKDYLSEFPGRLGIVLIDSCFQKGRGDLGYSLDDERKDLPTKEPMIPGIKTRALDSSNDPYTSPTSHQNPLRKRGKLLITASQPDLPSYEVKSLRHGIMTHALLNLFQYGDETLDVCELLSILNKGVSFVSSSYGLKQTVSLQGNPGKSVHMPPLVKGKNWNRLFGK